jgi:hypothetical protein
LRIYKFKETFKIFFSFFTNFKIKKGEQIIKKNTVVEDLEKKNLTLNLNTTSLKNYTREITSSSPTPSSSSTSTSHQSHFLFPLDACHSESKHAITSASKQRSTSINNLSRSILKNYTNIAASASSSLIQTNSLFVNQKLNNLDLLNNRKSSQPLKPNESFLLNPQPSKNSKYFEATSTAPLTENEVSICFVEKKLF